MFCKNKIEDIKRQTVDEEFQEQRSNYPSVEDGDEFDLEDIFL